MLYRYTILSYYVQYTLNYAHPKIIQMLDQRLLSLRGIPNRFIAPDMLTEKQNLSGRYDNEKLQT
jgi:hypothetical protein